MPQPTPLNPFGPERAPREAPDASLVAEDLVAELIKRCHRLDVDPGDAAALLALDLVASIAAYGRARWRSDVVGDDLGDLRVGGCGAGLFQRGHRVKPAVGAVLILSFGANSSGTSQGRW